jgi:hypothetical protein
MDNWAANPVQWLFLDLNAVFASCEQHRRHWNYGILLSAYASATASRAQQWVERRHSVRHLIRAEVVLASG